MAGQRVKIGTAVLELTTDNAGVVGGLKLVEAEFDKASRNLTGTLKSFGSQATSVGKSLSIGLTAPIVGVGTAAISMATAFNGSMANVASLIPGNVGRVNELKGAVQDMAIATGKSTEDLAAGLYQVISAFGDTADSAKILEMNARAAVAGVASTTDAINLTSAVTKGYGDTTAAAVQKVSDLALLTVRLGQTTFPELAGSIGRVTPLTAALKVSQEELFAVMATGTGVTGTASEVSTQLRGVLQSLMVPTESMTKLYKHLGVESGEALIKQRGLQGAIEAIVAAAKASGQPLQKFISSIEGQTLAMALAGPQADTLRAKLAEMAKAAGSTDEAFKEQTQGVNAAGFAWSQFKQEMVVASQQLGDVLLPILMGAGRQMRPLVDGLMELLSGFRSLPQPVQTTIVGLAGVAAAAGPVLFLVGQIAISTSGLVTAFSKGGIAAQVFVGGLHAVSFGLKLLWPLALSVGAVFASWKLQDLIGELFATAGGFKTLQTQLQEMGHKALTVGEQFQAATLQMWTFFNGGNLSRDQIVMMIMERRKKTDELKTSVADASKTEGIAAQITEAMAAAQRQSAAAMAEAAAESKAFASSLGLSEEAQKKAKAAAEKAQKAIDDERSALSSMGLVTEREVNTALEELAKLQVRATKDGTPMVAFLKAAQDKLEELAAKAKLAGLNLADLDDAIVEVREEIKKLGGNPVLDPKLFEVGSRAATLLAQNIKPITAATLDAGRQATITKGIYEAFGVESSTELKKMAVAARLAYGDMLKSGLYTAAQLKAAREDLLEFEARAGLRTVSIWEKTILPSIKGVISEISRSVGDGVVELIGHWERHGRIGKAIWTDLLDSFKRKLSDVVSYFADSFLNGMIGAILGKQNAFGSAFAALFTLGGGGAAGGIGTTISLLSPTSMAAGGAAAGGAWSAAVVGAIQAAGWAALGAWAGFELYKWFRFGFGSSPEMQPHPIGRRQNPDTGEWEDVIGTGIEEEEYRRRYPDPGQNPNAPIDPETGEAEPEFDPGQNVPNYDRGTPRLDYKRFKWGELIRAHGPEAIIPEGGAPKLAGEIASAITASGDQDADGDRRRTRTPNAMAPIYRGGHQLARDIATSLVTFGIERADTDEDTRADVRPLRTLPRIGLDPSRPSALVSGRNADETDDRERPRMRPIPSVSLGPGPGRTSVLGDIVSAWTGHDAGAANQGPMRQLHSGVSLAGMSGLDYAVGTPRLDFQQFKWGQWIRAHGAEAIIPKGRGHELGREVASALTSATPSPAQSAGNVYNLNFPNAIVVDGPSIRSVLFQFASMYEPVRTEFRRQRGIAD